MSLLSAPRDAAHGVPVQGGWAGPRDTQRVLNHSEGFKSHYFVEDFVYPGKYFLSLHRFVFLSFG